MIAHTYAVVATNGTVLGLFSDLLTAYERNSTSILFGSRIEHRNAYGKVLDTFTWADFNDTIEV